MKRLILLAAACYLLIPAGVASAHPLGNFTINRFARVEVAGHRLYVRYVVDMAEIPTLQHVPIRIGALHVSVDGGRSRCTSRGPRSPSTKAPQACGRRATRRCSPGRSRASANVSVDDRNYAGRIGWKEIVLGATARSDIGRAARVSEGPPPQPARHDPGVGQLTPTNDARRLAHGPRARAPDRIADSSFASLIGRST